MSTILFLEIYFGTINEKISINLERSTVIFYSKN
jgi:hypothetical protein